MIASVCGIVERVNKLISVRPMKSRYIPKIGDVVVGRVVSVGLFFSYLMIVGLFLVEYGHRFLSKCHT